MAKNRKKGKSRDETPAEANGEDRGQEKGKGSDKGLEQSKSPRSQAAAPKQAPKPAPKPRPKSAEERKKDQVDGITKTVYPAALGVLAGFACYYAPAETINQLPWHFVIVVVLTVIYFIQKVTYPLLKIDVSEFKGKDWFYVEFMALDLWLVTWTLLLN